ncbi:MAG TPA: SGNH/GDSL hydrolase family protein [Vicinamibacteria bacterium]
MKPRRAEILLLLGSLVFVLLVVEAALRLLGLAVPGATGYAPVNTKRRGMAPTNSRGYRDEERTIEKQPGTRRLLSLGDSFAWGAGIQWDDTYAQRLARTLSRRRGEPWEAVQLALPGMTTVDQASQLHEEGLAYGPDVVLLGYVLNDSEDAEAAEARRARDWAEEKNEKQEPRLLDRSALFRVVSSRLRATAENRRRIAGYRSMYRTDAPGWVAGQKALKLMGTLCTERGIPFVVAIFPLFGQPLDRGYPFAAIHAQVAQAAAGAGAKVVDLYPAYEGLRWEGLVVDGAADEHPNEIAHRIAADVLRKALDDVVPGPSAAPPVPSG